jgi:hypothetical protein
MPERMEAAEVTEGEELTERIEPQRNGENRVM